MGVSFFCAVAKALRQIIQNTKKVCISYLNVTFLFTFKNGYAIMIVLKKQSNRVAKTILSERKKL